MSETGWSPSKPIAAFFAAWRDMHVRQLMRRDVNPNTLTAIGLGINVVAAVAFAQGAHRLAGAVLFLAGMFDVLDGAYARKAGKVTRFGAFYDSTIDRYSDVVVFLGIIYYYAFGEGEGLTPGGRRLYVVVTGLALMGSVLTSYVRARAENIIPECHVGFLERAERTVLIIIVALASNVYMGMWIIAVLSQLTVLRRVIHFRTELYRIDAMERAAAEGGREGREIPLTSTIFRHPILNWVFFNFPRRTWQWDICCGVVILLCLFPPFGGPTPG
jgi:CDP-diacylglycerol--glycerol-3-phosphate 3-phosphatidyltransferase